MKNHYERKASEEDLGDLPQLTRDPSLQPLPEPSKGIQIRKYELECNGKIYYAEIEVRKRE
tara:strand:+ start:334 stop:516 length:183 start_codon:yes stop_codon:yes gene_type:complete